MDKIQKRLQINVDKFKNIELAMKVEIDEINNRYYVICPYCDRAWNVRESQRATSPAPLKEMAQIVR